MGWRLWVQQDGEWGHTGGSKTVEEGGLKGLWGGGTQRRRRESGQEVEKEGLRRQGVREGVVTPALLRKCCLGTGRYTQDLTY